MNTQTQQAHRTALKLTALTLAMFAFGFLVMPPLYTAFCEITGLGGKTAVTDNASAQSMPVDKSRIITVRFVTNTGDGMPWEFAVRERKVQVHPGELTHVDFNVHNRAAQANAGRAVPSMAPGIAGRHFKKTECFCFQEQTLAAGETRVMPMRFVIDPALPAEITELTLSYTFYRVQNRSAQTAAAAAKQNNSVNAGT